MTTSVERARSAVPVACAAFAATALGVLLVWSPWLPPPPALLDLDGKPMSRTLNDASAQDRVQRYKVFLGVLAAASLGALAIPRRRDAVTAPPAPSRRSPWWEAGAASLLGAAVLVTTWIWLVPAMPGRTHMVMFAGFYASSTQPSVTVLAAAVLAGAVALALLSRFGPRLSARTWWLLLAAYVLAMTVPGLFEPIVLVHTPPGMLPFVEWHFDAVLGGVPTLAAGNSERHMGYTYLVSLAAAVLARHGSGLSFAADIRLVQALNLVFALCVLWACHAWDRRRPLIALLTLALVLPWVQNNHLNIFFPNQSGMRCLFFPLTVVWVRASHRLPIGRAALGAGALAALALLWNLETGVAAAAGILVHLGARSARLSIGALLRWLAPFGAGVAAGLLAVGFAARLGLGRWPLDLPRKLAERTAVGSSYGYALYLEPIAILIFGYAIWAVLDLVRARRDGAVAPRTADRGALGVVALVWAVYYVLEPHPWNVWSYLLFGGLLLGDRLFAESEPCAPGRGLLRIAFVLAATIMVPAAVIGTLQTWYALERGTRLAGIAAFEAGGIGTVVSGVMLKTEDATAVTSRAAYLATVPADALVISGNSYLLPKLTGRVELFPYRDRSYAATRAQLRQLAAAIRARGPSLLLLDDPATLTGNELHGRYFAHLAGELSDRYRLERVVSGWSVYVPVH